MVPQIILVFHSWIEINDSDQFVINHLTDRMVFEGAYFFESK